MVADDNTRTASTTALPPPPLPPLLPLRQQLEEEKARMRALTSGIYSRGPAGCGLDRGRRLGQSGGEESACS